MHRMGLITSKMLKSPKFCNLRVLILSILTLVSCNVMKTHKELNPRPIFFDYDAVHLVCKPECGNFYYHRQLSCSSLCMSVTSHQFSMTGAS